MHTNKHIFALYCTITSALFISTDVGQEIIIADKDLFHRIMHILRLHPGDVFILFDQSINVLCEVKLLQGKNQIVIQVKNKENNKQPSPHIIFALPLLKKVDLESAVYALAEAGINTIQLIQTVKTATKWGGAKELDRLHRIVIAAAEQSKNFSLAVIKAPISFAAFADTCINASYEKFYFDPEGSSLLAVILDEKNEWMKRVSVPTIVLTVGPEGGFTDNEKRTLQELNFTFCRLTPTILRATQAASLSAGIFRSIVS